MTNPTPYNQLRQLLTDRLPHRFIQTESPEDLYDSCGGNIDDAYQIGYNEGEIDAQNVPTLSDVLLAINQSAHKHINIDTFGSIWDNKINADEDFVIRYDLTKPLADQTDEVLLDLIELVK